MKYTFHPFAKIELNEAVHYYESLAEREAISLAQYIVYTLTRQMSGGYTVRVVPEADVAKQRESFDSLLRNWGRISPAEADRILNGRGACRTGAGSATRGGQQTQSPNCP